MELQQLRYYSLIAKTGSITKAAEILFVSQPNLSMSIKRLEADVGVTLLDRSKGRIRLTPMGELFLECVDDVLTRLDKGIDTVRKCNSQPNKMLSIAAPGGTWLQAFCSGFSKHHPGEAFRAEVCHADDLIPALLRGEIDYAVGPKLEQELNVGWKPILNERLGLLVNKHHPLAQRSSVSLQELSGESFAINTSEYPKQYVFSLCRQADFVPKIVYECNDGKVLGAFLEKNMGITFIDSESENSFHLNLPKSDNCIIPISENITRVIGVLYLKNRNLPISPDEVASYYPQYYTRNQNK